MKNPTPKKVAIGAGLTGTSAAILYATPLIAQMYPGLAWVTIVVGIVPTIVAFLTNSREKVEASE